MIDDDLAPLLDDYFLSGAAREDREATMQEQSFAQGECPNCGHDWTAHGAWIANPGDKTCEGPVYEAVTLIVTMEDEPLHTEETGYECDEPDCICHWAAQHAQEEWSDPDDAFIQPIDLVAHTNALLDSIYRKED